MAASSSSRARQPGSTLGCIGKCTSGLSIEELDVITDHVHRTLNHPQGRKIFRKFLAQGRRRTDLACLDLYELCSECLDNEKIYRMQAREPTTEQLETDVNSVLTLAEELDGVREIDLALLERYTQALTNQSRESMIDVLEETKSRMTNHLAQAHKGFRTYAKQPCPQTR